MNTAAKPICLLLLCVGFAAGCTTPAGGKWPPRGVVSPRSANPPASAVPAEGLLLQVATERDSYILGEPVYLMLQLNNIGPRPQRVVGSLDPVDGAIEILVRPPDARPIHFVPLVEADHDEGIFVELAPQGSLGGVVPVFFGGNGWTFSSPGEYQLTAVYHSPSGEKMMMEAKSAALTLVIEPSADGAGEFLVGKGQQASNEAGKFLTWQAGDHLIAGRDHLQTVLVRWPESPLIHYVHSAFARSYSNRFADYRTRSIRPPDCARALDHLRQVADDRLPAYLRYQNAMTRARCAWRDGDQKGAQAALDYARGIVGDHPEYRSLRTQLDELEAHLNQPH